MALGQRHHGQPGKARGNGTARSHNQTNGNIAGNKLRLHKTILLHQVGHKRWFLEDDSPRQRRVEFLLCLTITTTTKVARRNRNSCPKQPTNGLDTQPAVFLCCNRNRSGYNGPPVAEKSRTATSPPRATPTSTRSGQTHPHTNGRNRQPSPAHTTLATSPHNTNTTGNTGSTNRHVHIRRR